MKPVILAAGQGSRLGNYTSNMPKSFVKITDQTIYEYQLKMLKPHIEQGSIDREITIVLGFGFSENKSKKIKEYIEIDDDIEYNVVYLDDWYRVENAASALEAVNSIGNDEDLLFLCGDIITTYDQMSAVLSSYQESIKSNGYSAVAAFEGIQNEMTAVMWDDDLTITDYGAIEGHQEAGIFILHEDHIDRASKIWSGKREDAWFPTIFPEIPSKAVQIDRSRHIEINTEEHLKLAERVLPFES